MLSQFQTYQCHKQVAAFQIAGVEERADGEYDVISAGGHRFRMTKDWCDRHRPKVGGYVVRYSDGYLSFSPKGAFEEGYSLIGDPASDGWDLTKALKFIREHQERVMNAGWCLMLAGGVLNRGHGPDLDLMVYPREQSSRMADFFQIFPGGEFSDVLVARVYTLYADVEGQQRRIEFMFQTCKAGLL